ncbi:MAG: ATP-binding cassette domain-containing protein [Clostridiales bacterium]|nr:ATP-binding cassette domain-containing protein [Clostridiales bacterium]
MKIEINNLTKTYGNNKAVNSLTLTLNEGIYGILGPNGSGKTTLINLLTDNVKRTDGEILINNKEILSLGAKYRDLIGYMPQQQALYNDFSAFMYLKYMCSVKGIKHDNELINNIMKKVNLYDVRNLKAGTFSGGMKQRLLFAQALLNNPKILILDEPTAGLDPKERINFRNMLAELSKDKIILLATHIVSDIECVADEVVLLKKGNLIAKDSPENLMKSISDKVFEIRGTKEELLSLQQNVGLGNIIHDQNGISLRIVTDKPNYNYVPVNDNISLEDVYLYYFEYLK